MKRATAILSTVCLLGTLGSALWGQAPSTVHLEPKPPEAFRWSDIAGNSYSTSFCNAFFYANANVSVTYELAQSPTAPVTGLLEGSGLKPNFSYQIKLEGKPTLNYGTEGDEEANGRIGKAGRWWVVEYNAITGAWVNWYNYDNQFGTNGDDRYDELAALDPPFVENGLKYVFTGYLLFDYFVTDGDGQIVLHPGVDSSPGYAFFVENSFHVTWNTVINHTTPSSNDGLIDFYTFKADDPDVYSRPSRRSKTVGLYGEWQKTRALPGTLLLPAGDYSVKLVLTEDSFHTADGNWASVLWGDVDFAVGEPAPAPVARDDTANVDEDGSVVIDVLWNDDASDGNDPLVITSVSVPGQGTTAVNEDGTITYIPDANVNGTDVFTYTITDSSGETATATVSVTVTPVNDAPVALPQSVEAIVGQSLTITLTGTDVDGDSLDFVIGSDGPTNGSVVNNGDGTITYTATGGTEDSFTFTVSDASETSAPATVSIAISAAASNAPPVGMDDHYYLSKRVNTVPGPGVLSNDSDPDGDALTAQIGTTTAHGSLTLYSDGSFQYKPDTRGDGDSFTYFVSDGDHVVGPITVAIN